MARSLQPQGMAETICGSPLYMAPEILQRQKYNAKVHICCVAVSSHFLGELCLVRSLQWRKMRNI